MSWECMGGLRKCVWGEHFTGTTKSSLDSISALKPTEYVSGATWASA